MPADYPDEPTSRRLRIAGALDAGWREVLAMLKRFTES